MVKINAKTPWYVIDFIEELMETGYVELIKNSIKNKEIKVYLGKECTELYTYDGIKIMLETRPEFRKKQADEKIKEIMADEWISKEIYSADHDHTNCTITLNFKDGSSLTHNYNTLATHSINNKSGSRTEYHGKLDKFLDTIRLIARVNHIQRIIHNI